MFLSMPDGWTAPTPADFERARGLAKAALLSERMDRYYYQRDRNYAGPTFWTLGSNPADEFVGDDLLAVTLLSVSVGPAGVRAVLEDHATRKNLTSALDNVTTERSLAEATEQDLLAMWELHTAVKQAISNPAATNANPWVTAAKLTARKRPALIPVRDNVVGKLLGNSALKNASVYWQLMRALLRDADVMSAMAAARVRLASYGTDALIGETESEPDLRLLDVALWISAVDGPSKVDPFAEADS